MLGMFVLFDEVAFVVFHRSGLGLLAIVIFIGALLFGVLFISDAILAGR